MTPDQKFARRVQAGLVLFVLLFTYFLAADLWLPITPQAQLTRPVLRVAPRISGQVIDVVVANNQHVEAGDLLFRLDPQPLQLAVDSAELALEQAEQDNLQLDAALAAARAEHAAAQASADELQRETTRLGRLIQSQHVSRQLFEQTQAQQRAAAAKLAAAAARIRELQAERGTTGSDNLRLRQARNSLQQARLNLSYSEVRAERAGVMSNLQLSIGAYLGSGEAVAALVADEADISADFREKALRYIRPDDAAAVVFDALPGEVFSAHVGALEAGVKEGQLDANGDLAAPVISDRWVRDAQRQRLHISLDDALPRALPSGAKATVQLFPQDSRLAGLLGQVQIRLISLLHYIY